MDAYQNVAIKDDEDIVEYNNYKRGGFSENEIDAAFALMTLSKQPPTLEIEELKDEISGSAGYQHFKEFICKNSTGYGSKESSPIIKSTPNEKCTPITSKSSNRVMKIRSGRIRNRPLIRKCRNLLMEIQNTSNMQNIDSD